MTVRGLRNPEAAVRQAVRMLKRSLYLVEGKPGEFGARIDAPGISIELDANREWRPAGQV